MTSYWDETSSAEGRSWVKDRAANSKPVMLRMRGKPQLYIYCKFAWTKDLNWLNKSWAL